MTVSNAKYLLPVFVLSLAGCTHGRQRPNPPATAEPTACPGDVQFGLPIGNICPPAQSADWSAPEQLFATISQRSKAGKELAKYCRYQWNGDPTDIELKDLPPENGRPPADWLAPDCNVVSALATPELGPVMEELRRSFDAQLDLAVPEGSPPKTVRVAVLDSASTNDWSYDEMEHGSAVAGLIGRIACPDKTHCALAGRSITLIPALAKTPDSEKSRPAAEHKGGFYGSQLDLAEAIHLALGKNDGTRLIINMSIGFLRSYKKAGAEVVRRALEVARCEGALLIAAAGNSEGGPRPESGPMYPAAWEKEPAPQDSGCVDMKGPLVYAAGGLDARDHRLTNTRDKGRPAINAPAAFYEFDRQTYSTRTSLDLPQPGEAALRSSEIRGPRYPQESVLSGSSLAAAGVSGLAALIWAYDPDLKPHQVMARIYSSSMKSDEKADFCLGSGDCPLIGRISVCAALKATRPRMTCTTHEFQDPRVPSLAALPEPATRHRQSRVTRADRAPIANDTHAVATPWTGPQPDQPTCHVCAVDLERKTLTVYINPNINFQVRSPVLQIDAVTIDLGLDQLFRPGDSFMVEALAGAPGAAKKASISFRVVAQGTTTNAGQSTLDEVLIK